MSRQDLLPLTDEEVVSLLSSLCAHGHVALAVSGGPDSTALMIAANRLAKLVDHAPRLSVLTVDHGLRPEAKQETALVHRQAQKLGLPCTVLRIKGLGAQESRIQERARQARYRLLGQWCLNHEAALATAHTLEDQAETFLMRLARGSGIDGLSGMASQGRVPFMDVFVPLLRPLLGVRRERLVAMVKAAGFDWVEDPSNRDVRFERVRMRMLLTQLEEAGLFPEAIARSVHRLHKIRHGVNQCLEEMIDNQFIHHAELGWGEFPLLAFRALEDALRERLLVFLVRLYGHGWGAALADIERLSHRLVERIDAMACPAGGFTLGGAVVMLARQRLLCGREVGRITESLILLPERSSGVWDRRFEISFSTLEEKVEICALGKVRAQAETEEDRALLKRPQGVPAKIWLSQPVVMAHGRIVALPAVGRLAPHRPFGKVSCRFVRQPVLDAAWGHDKYESWND